ncbi:hypothetical protein TWF481_005672 [Arthrobotrys musiformis]|uniref:CBM1 domain-containing protein n=1 Tax=Arthrobotrys musiformis TaxID=47236 RepID=A0AAV9WEH7_9PEZI
MFGFSRLNILVLALITFASFCTARTVITIDGKCSTRYCGYSVPNSKIYKTTKTVRTTARYTVTRWKTVTKAKVTKTVTATKKVTAIATKTISTVTSVTTKSGGTVTSTYTSSVTVPSFIGTFEITTKTLQSTQTVAAPSGFVGVNDDPDNEPAKRALQDGIRRRNAGPDPAAKQQYITAITCTKTLLTKTGTSDLWKTTTKSVGTTSKTVWTTQTIKSTKTVTKKDPVTIRSTITKFATVSEYTTVTVTKLTTSYLTTVTTSLPQTTYYEACGPRNQGPPPSELNFYAINASPDPGENLKIVWSNGTIYDCCVACQTYPGPGTCMGSVYNYQGHWGAPDCPELDWDICPPFIPEWYSRCELAISGGSAGTCRKHRYEYEWYFNQPPTVVSNGPGCKRFKYRKASQPL